MVGTTYHSSNRFSALRAQARSVSRDNRERSLSVKRRFDENSNATQPTDDISIDTETTTYTIVIDGTTLDSLKLELTKVASICDKVNYDLNNSEIDPAVKTVTGGLLEAIRGLGVIQGKLLPSTVSASLPTSTSYAKVASGPSLPAKRVRRDLNAQMEQQSQPNKATVETAQEKKRRIFKETIKECEKSTLLFNLDLGRVPIMNHDTMSTRASLALSRMAAKVENTSSTVPSEDARETLDDVLGLAKGISFYGKQTKTYRNPKDTENSGAFCTIPVRYDFKNRDTRARVEKVLREKCRIQCSTPYPALLRECIKQAADAVKQKYPGSIVRVNVDTNHCTLKLAKKAPGDNDFKFWDNHIPIPDIALDVSIKKVPDNFKLNVDLTESPQRLSRRDTFENNPASDAQQVSAEKAS